MRTKINKLPDFNKMTYEEEANWWDTHDITDYMSELKPVKVVVDLDRQKEDTLTVRLQKRIKEQLEKVARNKGLNVSTLTRMWIIEKLRGV